MQTVRTIGELMDQKETGATLVNMMSLDMIIGSGGLTTLPDASRRAIRRWTPISPKEITMLAVDSILMTPRSCGAAIDGASRKRPRRRFERDCLIKLGMDRAGWEDETGRNCLQRHD